MINVLHAHTDESLASTPSSSGDVVRGSHDSAVSVLDLSVAPKEGWSRITLDLPMVRRALGNLVVVERDNEYRDMVLYRCSGLRTTDGGSPEDGVGSTPDEAIVSYMQTLTSFPSNTTFLHKEKIVHWSEDDLQFHKMV